MFELSGFDFSEATLDAMFMMADLDGDGAIQLEEGLPYMRAIVMDQGFSVPAPMPELSGLSPELLDRYLKELFAMADENNGVQLTCCSWYMSIVVDWVLGVVDGVLQKDEFFKVGSCRWSYAVLLVHCGCVTKLTDATCRCLSSAAE